MKKRNELLNIAEALASFLVVCIHFPVPGNGEVTALARIAVPLFFSISGFFLYQGDREMERCRIPGKIKHLVGLILLSELSYLAFYTLLQMRHVGVSFQAVKNVYKAEVLDSYYQELADRLVVFEPPLNGVAWFIGSLIMVYLVVLLTIRHKWFLRFLHVFVILLPVSMLLRRVFMAVGWNAFILEERLLPLLPLPFFAIGYLIHRYKEDICSYSDRILLLAFGAGIALTLIEHYFWQHTLYIGTVVLVPVILLLCIKHEDYVPGTVATRLLSHIGAKTATYIYLFHILVETIVRVFASRLFPSAEQSVIWRIIYPVLVFAASAVFGELVCRTRKLLQH